MSSIDSKLRHFEHNVINKAAQERDQMLAELDAATRDALKETRAAYTQSAKALYAKGMDEARKEARMILSAAKNDGQTSVVSKRDEIINSVFEELELRLKKYVQSEEYKAYFTRKMEEAADVVLSIPTIPRKAEICLVEYDYEHHMQLAGPVAQRLMGRGIRVTFKKSEDDFIGGCVINLPTVGRVIDNSMRSDVMKEREDFLSWSHLSL